MITIIDYNVGNIGSISNMLNKIEVESIITSDIDTISKADKLILPGVGSFDTGMNNLKSLNLMEVLNQRVLIDKIPVLGICLGMQLLTNGSEEGKEKGLGWISSKSLKFRFTDNTYKVPNMGWNYVKQAKESRLFSGMFEKPRFYFVHSYYVHTEIETDILTSSTYGIEYTSSVEKENIIGVQFHPEKSHKFGMKLLKNFAELY